MLLSLSLNPDHFDGSYTITYAPTVTINREIDDLRNPRRAVLQNPFPERIASPVSGAPDPVDHLSPCKIFEEPLT